ncbi:unnamed protein product, partial [Didymodactylos carnosus]
IKAKACEIQPGLIIETCGSYRRGKATCGDVDILITHPDGKSHETILAPLVEQLRKSGFLTDDLINHSDGNSVSSTKVDDEFGVQFTYFGVCKLPTENSKHRRLDLIVIPKAEWACSLLYFTGSALFNRSMRRLARGMNMSLSQHGLSVGVVRKGVEKINLGKALSTPMEESVFQHLNLPYRKPEERDY